MGDGLAMGIFVGDGDGSGVLDGGCWIVGSFVGSAVGLVVGVGVIAVQFSAGRYFFE